MTLKFTPYYLTCLQKHYMYSMNLPKSQKHVFKGYEES